MEILKPELKDRAIETICNNVAMARMLKLEGVASYMTTLSKFDTTDLARALVASRMLVDNYLSNCWVLN